MSIYPHTRLIATTVLCTASSLRPRISTFTALIATAPGVLIPGPVMVSELAVSSSPSLFLWWTTGFTKLYKTFMSSECESLIRRILVLDPTRRYSLQQILSHPWMQAEVPPTPPLHQVQPMAEVGTINEQILRLTQSLGIDPARTKEETIKDEYDHHAAIYFLLLDRLKEQKNNIDKGQTDGKKRRPSTVAEQPLKRMPGAEDFQSLRLRTTSEATLGDLHRIHLAHHGPSVPIHLGPTNTLVVANGFHPTRACKIPPG